MMETCRILVWNFLRVFRTKSELLNIRAMNLYIDFYFLFLHFPRTCNFIGNTLIQLLEAAHWVSFDNFSSSYEIWFCTPLWKRVQYYFFFYIVHDISFHENHTIWNSSRIERGREVDESTQILTLKIKCTICWENPEIGKFQYGYKMNTMVSMATLKLLKEHFHELNTINYELKLMNYHYTQPMQTRFTNKQRTNHFLCKDNAHTSISAPLVVMIEQAKTSWITILIQFKCNISQFYYYHHFVEDEESLCYP